MAVFLLFLRTFLRNMVLSREVRIGLMVSISLVTFFLGVYFLKGADVFSNDKVYYCFYSNVNGLQKSANVQIRGLIVGHVMSMELVDDKAVKVSIAIKKSVELPEGTTAELVTELLGTQEITLNLGKGQGTLKSGATLATTVKSSLIDNVSGELTPRLQELKATIISLDTTLASINTLVGGENQKNITATIRSLKATADNFDKLSGVLAGESGELTSIMHNANSITGNLAKENDTVQHILANMSNVTRQLANAPVQKTMADLQKTTAALQGIMNKINNNQGSLGLLINDKAAYNNLNSTLKSLRDLTDDLKARPGRYINVSVFGKKQTQ
jgi:phospholipid/cholesterol/gamma-HCH transport system substrate-binding protein